MDYTPEALARFSDPQHSGDLADPHGVFTVGDEECGDSVRVMVRLTDDCARVAQVRYRIYGCPAAIACAEMTAAQAEGMFVEEIAALTDADIVTLLGGLPSGKEHCSAIAVRALQGAVAQALTAALFVRGGLAADGDEYRARFARGDYREFFPHTCDGTCGRPAESAPPAP
jgi:nitrogen fixation protein NifU and related proteins